MARIYHDFDKNRHGRLTVNAVSSDCVEVFYIPSPESLQQSGLDPGSGPEHRVKLLEFDGIDQCITIYPTKTLGGRDDFLQPKYSQIKRITLAYGDTIIYTGDGDAPSGSDGAFLSPYFGPTKLLGKVSMDFDSLQSVPSTQEEVLVVLEELPSAFTKDYDYGLGLAKPYRFIVNAVEQLSDCTEIVISNEQKTAINQDEGIFYISVDDFEKAIHGRR